MPPGAWRRRTCSRPRAGRLHLPGPYRIHEPHFAALRGLPLRRCHRLPAAAGSARMAEAAGKRILIVDDANLVRRFYRDALERAGFEVDEALNGVEALEKLLVEPFDLVIVDVNMPQMDGLTFLRTLRRQAAPVVFHSGAGHQHRGRRRRMPRAARAAGANFYLVKPVAQDTLVELRRPSCAGCRHERVPRTVPDRGPRAGRPGQRRPAGARGASRTTGSASTAPFAPSTR